MHGTSGVPLCFITLKRDELSSTMSTLMIFTDDIIAKVTVFATLGFLSGTKGVQNKLLWYNS